MSTGDRPPLPLVIRPAEGRDTDAIAAFAAACGPAEARRTAEWADGRRYVAVDEASSEVAGYGALRPEPGVFDPQTYAKYRLWLLVHPARQREGIGGALLARLEDDLRALGARAARARIPDDRADALDFARRRGFLPYQRMWRLRLDLDDTPDDPAALGAAAGRLAGQGIAIVMLAEERARDHDCLRKLHDLEHETDRDIPSGEPFRAKSLAEFIAWLERQGPLPDAFFLAKHGDEYVGQSWLARDDRDPAHLHQGMTGVRRAFRRGGLATALKLRAIAYARRHGYRAITTNALDANTGMLAVNERLGYRRAGSEIRLEKAL